VKFNEVTRSRTFFKSERDIMKGVRDSLVLLKKHEDRLEIVLQTLIVPGLIYKKSDLTKIAKMIKTLDARWELVAYDPQSTKSKRYSSVEPPTVKFLNNLREDILKEHATLRIEVKAAGQDQIF